MNRAVTVVEIGPRDGFQNVEAFIPTEVKLDIIRGLARAGFRKIQCASFVNPKAVPQMRDAAQIAEAVLAQFPQTAWFALVPNFRGAQDAMRAGLREIAYVISLSASHNRANVNKTHAESLDELARIVGELPEMRVAVDVATAFGCPFEGEMALEQLLELLGKAYSLGIREFTLCDTIGMAYPSQIQRALNAARAAFPGCAWGLHIHDTRNMGVLNSYLGIGWGADSVQTAAGGLGGCPFAPGASGNTATEDLIYLLDKEGIDTGVSFPALMETVRAMKRVVSGNYSGHSINIK